MGAYFDNYLTIRGSKKAVSAAISTLREFMDEYAAGPGDDAIHCDIDAVARPIRRGSVEASCYVAGYKLDVTEWAFKFLATHRAEINIDSICEYGCDQMVARRGSVERADWFGAEVKHSYFRLWCRSKSDSDSDSVWNELLDNLSQPDIRQDLGAGQFGHAIDFDAAALHVLAIGRLLARGTLPPDQKKIEGLADVVLSFPKILETAKKSSGALFDEDTEKSIPVAQSWIEQEVLRIEITRRAGCANNLQSVAAGHTGATAAFGRL